jgi:hypothetical protein
MDRLKLTKLVRPSGGKNSSPYRGQLPVEMGIKKITVIGSLHSNLHKELLGRKHFKNHNTNAKQQFRSSI